MDLKQAIEKGLDGNSILFVGSGFSRGATNLKDMPFMTGPELSTYFANRVGLAIPCELEDASEAFEEQFGEDELIKELQNGFTAKEVLPFHRQIVRIPWKRIYTTNYDNVVEAACHREGQRVMPITFSSNLYKTPKDDLLCIHLNGYIEKLDRSSIHSELKLTESSYITASLVDTEWAMLFRQDLRLASSVFFVGYSLYDLDIKRLLAKSDMLSEKCFFYIGPSPDEATRRRARTFGNVITESAECFADTMEEVSKDYIPKTYQEFGTLSLQEYLAPVNTVQIPDSAFWDLLFLGELSDNLIAESMRTGKSYFLERTRISDVFSLIDQGDRVFVIHSDLGNGKSMFLEGLCIRAIEQGFRVFKINDHGERIEAELEAVATLDGKVMVIIEEYQNFKDEIRVFRSIASDRAVIIMTARNAVHDIVVDDLTISCGIDEVFEIPVDFLDDEEINWFINVLNEYGLWGEQAGDSHYQKARFIKEKCNRQIHALLLKLLSSPDIQDRFAQLTARLRDKGKYYDILLSIFILTTLGHGPTLDILRDIWGVEVMGSLMFRKDPVVNELVNFNTYAVLARSPIAAEHLIRTCFDLGTIVSILTKMTERFAAGARFNQRYYDIFANLMRFRSLQLLLPEEGRRTAVIHYYESIKNIDKCKFNPLFWLQYAISSLVNNDLDRAKMYFDTAYSIALEKKWDTFQIDNHFARYLLRQASQDIPVQQAMANFREAKGIIYRQIKNERRHYPYRVAISLQDLIEQQGSRLAISEIEEVAQAATTILKRAESLPYNRRKHRNVQTCVKSLKYVNMRCCELIECHREKASTQQTDQVDRGN